MVSIEIVLLVFTCHSTSRQRISLVNYRQLVGYLNHFHVRLGPLDSDHAIFKSLRRHESLQDVGSAILNLVTDSGAHEAEQVSTRDVSHSEGEAFFFRLRVLLRFILIGRCHRHISRRIQTHSILFVESFIDLWESDVLEIFLQNVAFFC